MKQLYGLWLSGKSIAADVGKQAIGQGYPIFSWYCIMAGMGIFPDRDQLSAPTASGNHYNLAEVDNLLERSALNFRPQKDVLKDIPRKKKEGSLQIYFW